MMNSLRPKVFPLSIGKCDGVATFNKGDSVAPGDLFVKGLILDPVMGCGLSFMVWESNAGGLMADENECTYQDIELMMWGRGEGRGEVMGLPNGDEDPILRGFVGERTWADISGYITRLNGLKTHESFFGIDSTHVFLASAVSDTEQWITAPIDTGGCRSIGTSDFSAGEPGPAVKPATCLVRGSN